MGRADQRHGLELRAADQRPVQLAPVEVPARDQVHPFDDPDLRELDELDLRGVHPHALLAELRHVVEPHVLGQRVRREKRHRHQGSRGRT